MKNSNAPVQYLYCKILFPIRALLKNLHYSLPLSVSFQESNIFDKKVAQNVFLSGIYYKIGCFMRYLVKVTRANFSLTELKSTR